MDDFREFITGLARFAEEHGLPLETVIAARHAFDARRLMSAAPPEHGVKHRKPRQKAEAFTAPLTEMRLLSIDDFISACCTFPDENTPANSMRVERTALYAAYSAWATKTGERHPLSRRLFYEAIGRRKEVSGGTKDGPKWKDGDGRIVRGFYGIGLLASATSGDEEQYASARESTDDLF